jgi:hypothetical protein
VHHPRLRPYFAEHLEQTSVAHRVVVEVALGVAHRCGVAHLAGEVEHRVDSIQQPGNALIAHIAHLDLDVEAVHVPQVTAMLGLEHVDHADTGSFAYEAMHEVRTDEPQATRHQTRATRERVGRRRCGRGHGR